MSQKLYAKIAAFAQNVKVAPHLSHKEHFMKKLTQLGFSLLFGVFSAFSIANEKAQNPITEPTATEQKVEAKSVATNPNLVNINEASAAEIQDKLVGIGAKKAQAIVEYREKHGKFLSVEQLTEVSGIGKATLEKNRERIVIE